MKSDQINCPICAEKNVKEWNKNIDKEYCTSKEEYSYYKCNSCVTIFIDPMPIEKLNQIYPANYYSFSDGKKGLVVKLKEYLDQRIFKKILGSIKSEKINILDIGGGSGWLLDSIKKIDTRVSLTQVVDIDSQAKDLAEKKGHQYFCGPIESFETNEKFDLVLMLNLVEHISNPLKTLQKIEQILNKGGVVLIKTPNVESWDAELFKDSYWGGLHCPRHWVLFSKQSFNRVVEQTNLKVSYINYTQGAPFWTNSVLAKLEKYKLVKISAERPAIYHPLTPFLNLFFAGFDFFRGWFGFKTSQMFIELRKE